MQKSSVMPMRESDPMTVTAGQAASGNGITVSSWPALPRRVASQQSPLPLHRPTDYTPSDQPVPIYRVSDIGCGPDSVPYNPVSLAGGSPILSLIVLG